MIADGGIKIDSRVFTANAAAAVLLAIDNPEIAAGKRYSVADEAAFTMRQRIEFIAPPPRPRARARRHALRARVAVPSALAPRPRPSPDAQHADSRGARLPRPGVRRGGDGHDDRLAARPPPGAGAASSSARSAIPSTTAREDELVARWRAAREAVGPSSRRCRSRATSTATRRQPGEAWSAGSGAAGNRMSAGPPRRPLEGVRVARLHDRDGRPDGEHAARRLRRRGGQGRAAEGESSRRWGSARFGAQRRLERPVPRAQPQQGERSRST